MQKPNLFNYATSELSQDAIICYILEWANSEFKKIDESTHQIGIKLLDAFFDKYADTIKKPDTYENIEVIKQDNNIDVLCIVNNKYPIIIEDKTNTKNHGDQLKRYFEQIESREEFESKNIMCIYYKTYDQSCYKEIENDKYKVFSRKEILNVLNSISTDNNIINDYKLYLQKIENNVNSYKLLPVNEWSWDSWKGFYLELQKQLDDGNWDYVPNAQGGFLGFWWHYPKINSKYSIYLQIETSFKNNKTSSYKLAVKLYFQEKIDTNKNIVNSWKKHIINNGDNLIIKPKVVKVGKSSAVGLINEEFIKVNDSNLLDMARTIDSLQEIEKKLDMLVNTFKKNQDDTI